jgi:hypothetical protein
MNTKKFKNTVILSLITTLSLFSCQDYLYVVPDDIPTLDHAFSNRTTTEKYLFTCYSYLPDPGLAFNYPGLMSSRECWLLPSTGSSWYWVNGSSTDGALLRAWNIARGLQNSNTVLCNYWDGNDGGTPLFVAIRDCNIFLENIDKPTGIDPYEKEKWIAEVKFLKAYYHFYLMRMYGPIPIIRENLPITATPDEVRIYRDPVEDVANYIISLLDEAAEVLPSAVVNTTEEMGRATKTIVLAVKAQVLTLMASPLFNGNPYYRNFADNRGTILFPQESDPAKWEKAATAIKEAIDLAETEDNRKLFTFKEPVTTTPALIQEMSLRGAVTERWNEEIIWGSTKGDGPLQLLCTIRTVSGTPSGNFSAIAPTLEEAELFYTANGLPITEDREYIQLYPDIYATSVAGSADANYIRPGFETANLHFKREPRFYSSLIIDGGYLFGNGNVLRNTDLKFGTMGGGSSQNYSITGYFPKKLVNRESVLATNGWTEHLYSYPVIRLSDLYLLYAEALNEMKAAPDDEVYEYIDKVRERAGLKGVRETWTSSASLHPEYINSKDRMREIIHRERRIELAFEPAPYWDILRWKEAEALWNRKPIRGWNNFGTNAATFYQVTTVGTSNFSYKEYLTPIRQSSLDRNPNLVQNPGW